MSQNESDAPDAKEAVRRLLRVAFSTERVRRSQSALSHEEAVQMRSRLALLTSQDLPDCLGQVLEDLLDSHTGRAGDSQDAEAVIQHLNVLVEGSDFDGILKHLGPAAFEQAMVEENLIRLNLAESYASFTPSQAQAIAEWLALARGWEDLEWYQDEIVAALSYWQYRANRPEITQRR